MARDTSEGSVAMLQRELEALRTETRRARRASHAAVALAMLCTVSLVVASVWARQWTQTIASPREVRSGRFVLVGADGAERGEWVAQPDGAELSMTGTVEPGMRGAAQARPVTRGDEASAGVSVGSDPHVRMAASTAGASGEAAVIAGERVDAGGREAQLVASSDGARVEVGGADDGALGSLTSRASGAELQIRLASASASLSASRGTAADSATAVPSLLLSESEHHRSVFASAGPPPGPSLALVGDRGAVRAFGGGGRPALMIDEHISADETRTVWQSPVAPTPAGPH